MPPCCAMPLCHAMHTRSSMRACACVGMHACVHACVLVLVACVCVQAVIQGGPDWPLSKAAGCEQLEASAPPLAMQGTQEEEKEGSARPGSPCGGPAKAAGHDFSR